MRLSETEWQVMNALWKQHPASVRTIFEQLQSETGWAYNTVRTILNRLVEKGAVQSKMAGSFAEYSPILRDFSSYIPTTFKHSSIRLFLLA